MEAAAYIRMTTTADRHWWFSARRRIIAAMLRRLHLPADSRILEIGCGTGTNLEMLRKFGQVEAIEGDDMARDVARNLRSVTVGEGWLPDGLPDFAEPFDLVALLDVLEHIEQDSASLDRVFGLLKPGGRLITTVPAFQFMWSVHDRFHHHFRRYRLGPLRRMMNQSGFVVDYATHYNTLLFPPITALRLMGRLFGETNPQAALKVPPAPINAVLREIFALERLIVPFLPMPLGVSLMMIARRPMESADTDAP